MRFSIPVVLGLSMLTMLTGCDFGDPNTVQPKMEEALRPYFPKVVAHAFPNEHVLLGLTCVQNVGNGMIEMVAPAIASNPAMKQLRLLRMVPGSSYRVVGIGFEQGIVRYNVDTQETDTVYMNADYSAAYRQQCGLDEGRSVEAVAPQPPAVKGYVWIGHFTATTTYHDQFTGTHRYQMLIIDSLGIYASEEEFQRAKDDEIATRRGMVEKQLSKRGIKLVSLSLDSVDHVEIH